MDLITEEDKERVNALRRVLDAEKYPETYTVNMDTYFSVLRYIIHHHQHRSPSRHVDVKFGDRGGLMYKGTELICDRKV